MTRSSRGPAGRSATRADAASGGRTGAFLCIVAVAVAGCRTTSAGLEPLGGGEPRAAPRLPAPRLVAPDQEEAPGAENRLDRENGFRGVKFGTTLSASRKLLNYLSHKGKWQYFTRRDEEMRLGQAALLAVYYSFYRSQLAQVTIIAKGKANTEALLAWMQENYGAGHATGADGRRTGWRGARTGATCELNPSTEVGIVVLYSRAHLPTR